MAVYYKWIKGCSEGSTLGSGLWSYIKWGERLLNNSLDGKELGFNTEALPTLKLNEGKNDSIQTLDLGYFLTNRAKGVEIEKDWTFISCEAIPETKAGHRLQIDGPYIASSIDLWIKSHLQATEGCTLHGDLVLEEAYGTSTENFGKNTRLWVKTKSKFEAMVEMNNMLSVSKQITSHDSVHAPYFNATSDMRAKENIKKLPFSALAFINNLNVYQFNYKDKNDTIPGVLAQDVLNCQPEGLSLVDNIDASGENGDYMSIKEDKFIFLLMRAVQELKEDNDALRYEIEQLKQKLK